MQYMEHMDELGDIMAEVKDKASAEAAAIKWEAKIAQIQTLADGLGEYSDEEIGMASVKHAQELQQMQIQFSQKMMPVMMNPDYANMFSDAMSKLPEFGK